MKTPSFVLRAGPACLASALLVLTGCAHTTTRQATDPWPTDSVIGVLDDADVQVPVALRQERPEYPIDMRRAGITGLVHVNCLVDEDGRVTQAAAYSDTNHELTASALRAVKKWNFSPGTRNGIPVPMRVNIPIVFEMLDE